MITARLMTGSSSSSSPRTPGSQRSTARAVRRPQSGGLDDRGRAGHEVADRRRRRRRSSRSVSALIITLPRLSSNWQRRCTYSPFASRRRRCRSAAACATTRASRPSTTSRVSVTPTCRLSLAPNSPSTLLSDAWLVHGMTMSQGTVNSLPGIGSGAAASARVRRPEARALEDDAVHVAIRSSASTSTGEAKYSNTHALEAGLVLLLLVDDHLLRAAAVDDRAGLGAQAQRGARSSPWRCSRHR